MEVRTDDDPATWLEAVRQLRVCDSVVFTFEAA